MIDLKNPKLEDFKIIEASKHELKPGQKVHCTFFRLKPGSDKPARRKHAITEMPKEMYEAFFQKRV